MTPEEQQERDRLAEEYRKIELQCNPGGYFVAPFVNSDVLSTAFEVGWDKCAAYRDAKAQSVSDDEIRKAIMSIDGFAACNVDEPSEGDLKRVYTAYTNLWHKFDSLLALQERDKAALAEKDLTFKRFEMVSDEREAKLENQLKETQEKIAELEHKLKIKEARLEESKHYIKGYQGTIDSFRREIEALRECLSYIPLTGNMESLNDFMKRANKIRAEREEG